MLNTIDLNKQQNIEFLLFPDNQPHVRIKNIAPHHEVRVICAIKSSQDLFQLLATSNALDNAKAEKSYLCIPYLMGARSDRVMVLGDSVDLKVVCDLINYMNFKHVFLYDVHSDAALHWINNVTNHSNENLVKVYNDPDSILICPDVGASKKVDKYFSWNSNIKDVVYCIKSRDLTNGKISLKVLEPEKCKDKNCVTIDDLCDGGGTFLGIVSQIQPLKHTLIVTHGIFSKGTRILEEKFDKIITSNSYTSNNYSSEKLQIINHSFYE